MTRKRLLLLLAISAPVLLLLGCARDYPSITSRAEQILVLAEGRTSYYDKDFVYLDLVEFSPEDLPACTITFLGVVFDENGSTVFEKEGLAFVLGPNHEYILVPLSLIPVIPESLPPAPPVPGATAVLPDIDLSQWEAHMFLVNKEGTLSALASPNIVPELRIAWFVINEQNQVDRIRESIPDACKDLTVGDSSRIEPLDALIILGFDGALISARTKAVSRENHGFYFDGTILPQDMGALIFALRLGMPELVGIVTGGNWSMGYETHNFSTNFDEILDALTKP